MNEPERVPYAVVVADAHIDGEHSALQEFLSFLHGLPSIRIRALYILGDLFNVWLGAPRLQLPYQGSVLEALRTLSHQGIDLIYVEGNRDYFLAPAYLGDPFRDIASESIWAEIGNHRIHFSHGDLVNVEDTQYRMWRHFSRNRGVYGMFNILPSFLALKLARYLESTFQATNQKHKTTFPADLCERYAHALFEDYDTIILGHFHQQFHQSFQFHKQAKQVYALPAWKDTPVYLEITTQGECLFQMFHGK